MDTENSNRRDIAIVAVTRQGTSLGRRLKGRLPDSRLYLPERFAGETGTGEFAFSSAKDLIAEIFGGYRYLVLVMAAGIAVRLVAPNIRDKYTDPGVVVVDDTGSFSISLLSGHIGGANELAGKIAALLGARPVVTTASDVNRLLSPDILGKEFGWVIKGKDCLRAASAALVNGEAVGIFQDAGERNWRPEAAPLPDNVTVYDSLEELQKSSSKVALLITDRVMDEGLYASLPGDTIVYRPQSLVVGIGCNRGTRYVAIEAAVGQALSAHGLSMRCVRTLATLDVKKDEPGLLKFALQNNLPVAYYDRETLRRVRVPSGPSPAAMRHVGTPSVCEAAALLSSHASQLLVPKVSFGRAVTVAVARLSGDGSPPPRKGRLFLVGIGPGDLKCLTFEARDALESSEVVVGYKTYIELIKPLLGSQRVIAAGMGAEVERAMTAISLAGQGKTVALVSSGDSGVYGMAGLVGEFLHEQKEPDIEIRVIPGLPALVAGAALLGSPISGDFASVSLSDYLVPWPEICRRLRLAAESGLVMVIYNPKSRHRRRHLDEAREIILQYRAPATPVGIVTNAFREGQEVTITDLEHLPECEVGMNTTVIIGNSTTLSRDGRMITPRGYHTKYNLGEARERLMEEGDRP